VTAVVEYIAKADGSGGSSSSRNFLDLDSGAYHNEFPSSFAKEFGQRDDDKLRRAGVDMWIKYLQGGLKMLMTSRLKLTPVPDKAWDGETGLIVDAIDRVVPAPLPPLGGFIGARTWAFQTNDGGIGVMRTEALNNSKGVWDGLTIRYRLLSKPGEAATTAPGR
jgi:hypothetical protein